MFRKALSIFFNDAPRGDDRRTPALVPGGKPPVLRRRTLNVLGAFLLAVICYGSFMPFELKSEWVWTWRLPLDKPFPPDFVTNLILYFPIGFFLRLFYRRRGTRPLAEITLSLLTILAVSYGTELCQQVLVARVASLTDVIGNVAGAAAGILLAPTVQRGLRNLHGWLYTALHERPFTAAAAMLTLVIFAGALLPFDPLPTPSHVQSRLEAVMKAESLLPFGAGWSDPDMAGAVTLAKVMAIGAYGFLAFLLVFAERERGHRPGQGALYAFTRVAALAAGIELIQLFTISHAFVPADLTGAWISAGLGSLVACGCLVLNARLPLHRLMLIRALTLLVLAVLILGTTLPLLDIEQPGSAPLRLGLPMLSNFHMNWNALLARYTGDFMRYLLIIGAVVAWRRAGGEAPREVMIVATALVAVGGMTALAWWQNQPFDSCHLFLAGLAAVLVHRADDAFFGSPPRAMRPDSPVLRGEVRPS